MLETKPPSPGTAGVAGGGYHRRWAAPLLASVLLSSLLIAASLFFSSSRALLLSFSPLPSAASAEPLFVEAKLRQQQQMRGAAASGGRGRGAVPRIAYLVSGSAGDGAALRRTLRALYHPSNMYVVHLDLEAPATERAELAAAVRADPVYSRFRNVKVVTRANLVTYRGPTMVANTLHAAAILLREGGEWDWFINLSASDYPLVTQDDLLYVLSDLPRQLNFIEHTSDIGWKEYQRAKPVIIDPGLYSLQKSDVFWITEKRSVPTAFKLFTGSAWMMLTHQFIEYCIWGWDNLPRTVLMYYANFLSSPEGYFHTVICNVPEFRNTTVNHDLHFISWDNPPKQHPHYLTLNDFDGMVNSNAPFARKFGREDPVLDKIDQELLGRQPDGFVAGGWMDLLNTTTVKGSFTVERVQDLRPGPGADRLKKLVTGLLTQEGFDDKHCL
ncbi:beta-glucuronosyltransferase GlcAT14A-like [Oryza glaberrima]|uniref:BGGP Beta-1-3-galactosyl-O-glycosyl-glycoprotein n=2 Tax=Oryza TaxID=4527 RepID=A0A0D3GIF5_9ORYZ|nr:beta-glucuronosyltransferase GlcAT14A-like [Oryza glaberrima]